MSAGIKVDSNVDTAKSEIEARRIARKRKILENSKDRLEKLYGRKLNSDETIQNGNVHTKESYPVPELEKDLFVNNTTSDGFLQSSALNGSTLNGPRFPATDGIYGLFNDLAANASASRTSANTFQKTLAPKTKFHRFLESKGHLAVLALISYCFFTTGYARFISSTVFLPLLLWEITEMFLLKTHTAPAGGSLLGIVLLLGGISPNQTKFFTKALETIHKVINDAGVFIFFFVLCHLTISIGIFGDWSILNYDDYQMFHRI